MEKMNPNELNDKILLMLNGLKTSDAKRILQTIIDCIEHSYSIVNIPEKKLN